MPTVGMLSSPLILLQYLIATVFLLVGVVVAVQAARRFRSQRLAIRRAEETVGTVERATIQPVVGGMAKSYIPVVEYEYQTPFERLTGETVYPGGNRFTKRFSTESAARTAISSYNVDSQTTVYYDPENPTHSFLDPEPQTAGEVARFGIGIGSIAVGVFLAVFI